MKNRLFSFVNGLIVITLLTFFVQLQPISTSVSASSSTLSTSSIFQQNDNDKVTMYRDENLRAHLNVLKAKDKSLARALKEMEKIGKVPDWRHSFAAKIEKAKTSSSLNLNPLVEKAAYSPSQQFSDNGDEVIVITSYGAESYWDGTVYVYDGASGETSTYNGVCARAVNSDSSTADIVDEWYYPSDGGAPQHEFYGGSGSPRLPLEQQIVTTTKNPSSITKNSFVSNFAKASSPSRRVLGTLFCAIRCVVRNITVSCNASERSAFSCRLGANVHQMFVCGRNC